MTTKSLAVLAALMFACNASAQLQPSGPLGGSGRGGDYDPFTRRQPTPYPSANRNSPQTAPAQNTQIAAPSAKDQQFAQAIRLYPALAEKDSPLNKAFLALYADAKAKTPEVFQLGDWPVRLAGAAASSLGIQSTVPAQPTTAREAAEAYIQELTAQGVVFGSEYRMMIGYPNLFPAKTEVIYVLDYMSQAGRLVAPYTITTQQRGDGWVAIGGTPGDRRANFTDPVIGKDGKWQRSPMEQFMGDAMNRGMK